MSSKYAVQVTNDEGIEAVLVGKFDTREAAVKAAKSKAADVEFDGPTSALVVVTDASGNAVWDNEGDWRNAVRN